MTVRVYSHEVRIRPIDLVDIFVYLVVLGVFIQLFPEVISESFLLALLTAVLLKAVLEIVGAARDNSQPTKQRRRTAGRVVVTDVAVRAYCEGPSCGPVVDAVDPYALHGTKLLDWKGVAVQEMSCRFGDEVVQTEMLAVDRQVHGGREATGPRVASGPASTVVGDRAGAIADPALR